MLLMLLTYTMSKRSNGSGKLEKRKKAMDIFVHKALDVYRTCPRGEVAVGEVAAAGAAVAAVGRTGSKSTRRVKRAILAV